MKETGILFTPENIRLIREKRKWQTRRVVQFPQPRDKKYGLVDWQTTVMGNRLHVTSKDGIVFDTPSGPSLGMQDHMLSCPQGERGDRLYIKEGVIIHGSIPQLVGYYMDGCRVTESWETRRTAMFMPKWAARTWLKLTDVRVERLQDISEEDALAEGIDDAWLVKNHVAPPRRSAYGLVMWDSINRKKHPWKSNPWVWRLSLQILESR